MQKVAPEIFYELGKNNYDDLFFIFRDILNSELNKTSIDIMIKLNYFCDYGDINFILNQLEIYKKMKSIYDKFNTCKQLKKDECINIGFDLNEVKLCAKTETEKMFKDIDNKKLVDLFNKNYVSISKKFLKEFQTPKTTDYDIIHYQLQILGSSDKIISDSDSYGVSQIEINQYGTPFITLYQISNGQSQQYKCEKSYFNSYPCEQGDILNVAFREKKKKRFIGTDKNGKNQYEDTDETEQIIKLYSIKN
jgi:DNA polymerase III subunit alpha